MLRMGVKPLEIPEIMLEKSAEAEKTAAVTDQELASAPPRPDIEVVEAVPAACPKCSSPLSGLEKKFGHCMSCGSSIYTGSDKKPVNVEVHI